MADLGQAAAWHRQIAALVAAADRAGVASTDLPPLRNRLFAQQARFAEIAARAGTPLPALVPTPTEIAAAAGALGDLTDETVAGAVRSATATLDAADAALVQTPAEVRVPALAVSAAPSAAAPVPGPSGAPEPALIEGSPALRNALIYSAYSAAVLAVQAVLFVLLNEERSLVFAAPVCVLVLPAFAWLAGWLTIGVVAGKQPGQARHRSPRLGAAICAVPDMLLCSGLLVLIILNLVRR